MDCLVVLCVGLTKEMVFLDVHGTLWAGMYNCTLAWLSGVPHI